MKKIIVMATALVSVVACDKKVDYAVLSGKVTNVADNKLYLLHNNKLSKEILVGEDGTFRDTIRGIAGKNYYALSAQRKNVSIFLQEGTNLVVEFDGDITQAQFSGVDAEQTKYLLERDKEVNQAVKLELFSKNPSDFKNELKAVFESVKSKAQSPNFDKSFVQNQQKWADSYFVLLLSQYTKYNRVATQSEQEIEVPADFYAEKEAIDMDVAQDYDNVSTYHNLVNAHFFQMLTNPNDTEQLNKLFAEIKKLKSQNIKEGISRPLVSLISTQNPNNQLIVDFINANVNDEELKQEAKTAFEGVQKLMKGSPSPTFTYENYNGGQTSLEDLRGKYVYIDVWATWCRPCLMELPALKTLEKDFHGKDIEFVSISVDKKEDREKWRALVEKENLKGVQLFSDNSWESDFVRSYMINGIPRFILLDKEGNIIDADATRPSDPQTRQTLTELLK